MQVEVTLVSGKRFCGYSFTNRIEVPIVASPVVEDDCTTYNGTVCYDTNAPSWRKATKGVKPKDFPVCAHLLDKLGNKHGRSALKHPEFGYHSLEPLPVCILQTLVDVHEGILVAIGE